MTERIILGVDPGTVIMGYGIIKICGKEPELLGMGVVNLVKISDPYLKLREIYNSTIQLIEKYLPDELAIEAPFYGNNVQSMLKLGRAQGVAISAALQRDLPIFEYAPRKVKMSITGSGSAAKEQVAAMLQHVFKFKDIPKNLDATDGVAVALCHFYQRNNTSGSNNYSNWGDFLKKNPNRLSD